MKVRNHDFVFINVLTCWTALRVEWFRACERHLRWKEEVMWIQREMSSVILRFHIRSSHWTSQAENASTTGTRAYAYRQATSWRTLKADAALKFHDILIVSSNQNALTPAN